MFILQFGIQLTIACNAYNGTIKFFIWKSSFINENKSFHLLLIDPFKFIFLGKKFKLFYMD